MPVPADIQIFRRFNRTYTKYIGTLDEKLLKSDFSLSEARVLYELANRSEPSATEIADELGMDPGYLSRVLRKFERAGLLRRTPAEEDRRLTKLVLSRRGKAAFKKLDALSTQQARSALEDLPLSSRMDLIQSMRAIEAIVANVDRSRLPFILRPHRIGDMGWIVYREGIGYAEQFGWDQTFEALVSRIVDEFITNFDPHKERCWISEIDGQHVGHVFLVKHPEQPQTAKLRLLFVEPSARGKGVGHALTAECIRFARTAGYRRVVLWTQSILTPAHRIYRQAGFRLVKEEPHHSFGHDLIGQEWELDLA